MENKLHIVSFDVPYPADYGGAIDVFYKIKALHAQGCKIYLHCYEYGRGTAPELARYCEEVCYYPRNTGLKGISFSQPYIVSSRCSALLLKRLQEITAPILFEGVHPTFLLSHASLKDRFKAIRIHNIEHEYYELLSKKAISTFEKIYFKREAGLLRKYEHQLNTANAFYALSAEDSKFFKALYPKAQHAFIPPFHQYDEVSITEGTGTYCLYHGNLSHPENIEAVMYLLTKIFPKVSLPIVIAGKNPVKAIETACMSLPGCRLVANPGKDEMDNLVANAQIHILVTFQQSGMKLKLLSALYRGKHVVVNDAMLYGTNMPEGLCILANNDSEMVNAINSHQHTPFTSADITKRKELLAPYGNSNNAVNLLQQIFG